MLATALFDGVVSAQTERVVEFFLDREAAEAMIREVWEDEPVPEELRVRRSSWARRLRARRARFETG